MPHTNDDVPFAGAEAAWDHVTGAVYSPPTTWSLLEKLSTIAGDAFDEVVLSRTNGSGNTYAVNHARRSCMPTQLRFNGIDLLRRVDVGQATGVAERNSYDNPSTPTPEFPRIEFNPTYGGSILKPDSSLQTRIYPSPPLHFLTAMTPPEAPDGFWVEGAVIPMEFDSGGEEIANHKQHQGTATTPGLYWRSRMFQRLTVNWVPPDSTDGLGVLDDVHEFFAASYYPRAIKGTGPNPRTNVAALFGASLWLVDHFGRSAGGSTVTAEVYVPKDATGNPKSFNLNAATGFNGPPTTGPTGDPSNVYFWEQRDRLNLSFRMDATEVQALERDGEPTPPINQLIHSRVSIVPPSGIVAAILTNSSPAVSVGVVAQLSPGPNGQTTQNELGISQLRSVLANPPANLFDRNSGQRLSIRTRSRPGVPGISGRDAGWIGIRYFVITKTTAAAVKTTIDTLLLKGVFDGGLPFHYIPRRVFNVSHDQ